MMSDYVDKLRAAAAESRKRLRDRGTMPISDPYVAMAYTQDLLNLSAENLIDHPADDAEMMTGAWSASVGFVRPMQPAADNSLFIGAPVPAHGLDRVVVYPLRFRFPARHYGVVPVWTVEVYGYGWDQDFAPTRGQGRALAKALCIPLTEGGS